MKNIIILIILTLGLIFTSLIKNKTRLLEKELVGLNKDIVNLNSNLEEARLDFEYLTTPKNIYLLSKNLLDDDFLYYQSSQIQKKSRKKVKILADTKKLENSNTAEPNSEFESPIINLYANKKSYNNNSQKTKDTSLSKKAHNMLFVQVLKSLFGLPTLPVK